MASDESSLNYTIIFADPPDSARFVSVRVPVNSLNEEIMDVAFSKAMGEQNYPGGMQAMVEAHRFDDAVALGEHWAHKYLVDLDGMSYSGRFMAFMASDSAVLKATVYREYFSDWIQPWCVHLAHLFYHPHPGFADFLCIRQASLYTPLSVVRGSLQHPCLLFRRHTIDVGSCQFDCTARIIRKTAICGWRSSAAENCQGGKAVEEDDWQDHRYGG